jgi:hypothetical protein
MDSVSITTGLTGADAPQSVEQALQPTQQEPQIGQQTNRPNWLPQKFQNPEELAKAYQSLEKRLGQPRNDNPENLPSVEQPDDTSVDDTPAEEAPNIDPKLMADRQAQMQAWSQQFGEFSNEYMVSGKLSEQSYAKLSQMGYPPAVVDAYIEGQKAVAEKSTYDLLEQVGGKRGFKEIHDWAAQSLSEDEIKSYNALLESGSDQQAQFAVKGLYARYKAANGSNPRLLNGSQGKVTSGAFRSVAEVTRAMSDPRYKSDPAYRKDVERKLESSNVF